MKDYYKILEVDNSASSEVIAKVYKILAKKYHPDVNPNNKQDFEKKFKEISEAYEILSDEEKRKNYDIQLENFKQYELNKTHNEDYENLKAYCIELQDELNSIKKAFNYDQNNNITYNSNIYPDFNNTASYQKAVNQAYQDAMNKAYNDAYENTLRNLGYKIHYKKTFKHYIKNFIALVLSALVIIIILFIVWHIPSLKNSITSLFIL